MRRVLGTAAVVALVATSVHLSRSVGSESTPAPEQIVLAPAPVQSPASTGNDDAEAPPDPFASTPLAASAAHVAALRKRLAKSGLRGAEPDGAIVVGADGRLHPDRALRRLFDWYLALSGELPLVDIRTLLGADVRDTHGDTIATGVLALFDRYLDLQRAMAAIAPELDGHTRLDALRALRRQWLGASAEAMFGDEEAALSRSLDRLALLGDPRLSDTERGALAAELDAMLPDTERALREEIAVASLADEQSRQFETLGTDAATRRDERADLFGEAAADRLAALDAERAAWDSRLSDYVRERDALRNSGLEAATRDARLAQLRARSFAENELRRVDALDAVGALPPGG